eukprot:Awhi_evm1s14146
MKVFDFIFCLTSSTSSLSSELESLKEFKLEFKERSNDGDNRDACFGTMFDPAIDWYKMVHTPVKCFISTTWDRV